MCWYDRDAQRFVNYGQSPRAAIVEGVSYASLWYAGVLHFEGATAAFSDYEFTVIVGPIVDGDLIAGHWVFRRNPRITLPLARAVVASDLGVPALAFGGEEGVDLVG